MEYIAHRDFNGIAICGKVNIKALTRCECIDGVIMLGKNKLCLAVSENAHDYFANNDDKNGIERGDLTRRIKTLLAKNDGKHQERWDKVIGDELCWKYRRKEHEDHWLWNHMFYNARIEDLRYIAALIGA